MEVIWVVWVGAVLLALLCGYLVGLVAGSRRPNPRVRVYLRGSRQRR